MEREPAIGFIGQGWIGKHYADDFESRGYEVVRYALEEPYRANKSRIPACDIVFIAVPTPTTPAGFDDSIVREAVELVGAGKVAVVKSTVVPGTTAAIQAAHPGPVVLYAPEFLREVTAAHDAAHPFANIIGIAADTPAHRRAASRTLAVLPAAPYARVMSSTEAELVKYAHNGSGYTQIIFFNLMYDLAAALGYGWEGIGEALRADPMISNLYANPVHKNGRGAGGHCFIKDFAALGACYERLVDDSLGAAVFRAAEEKNKALLTASGKDLDLLAGVYGRAARPTPSA
jgi:UDPglucose 6-dehydrogenase